MTLGAHGRRLALIFGCLFVSVFTFANIFTKDAYSLMAVRFVVGVGLGGIIANIIALASEFAPKGWRAREESGELKHQVAGPFGPNEKSTVFVMMVQRLAETVPLAGAPHDPCTNPNGDAH